MTIKNRCIDFAKAARNIALRESIFVTPVLLGGAYVGGINYAGEALEGYLICRLSFGVAKSVRHFNGWIMSDIRKALTGGAAIAAISTVCWLGYGVKQRVSLDARKDAAQDLAFQSAADAIFRNANTGHGCKTYTRFAPWGQTGETAGEVCIDLEKRPNMPSDQYVDAAMTINGQRPFNVHMVRRREDGKYMYVHS